MSSTSVLKKSTGLAGLIVARTPHYTLTQLYNKTLKELFKMPEDANYRKYTEQTIRERLDIVSKEEDVAKIEEIIGCGQIEEIIVQAENELSLARRFLKSEPWKPLTTTAPDNQWKWPLY